MKKPFIDPFQELLESGLNERKIAKSPAISRISKKALLDIVRRTDSKLTVPDTAPAMELTARHPHDPAGFMDSYHPGRWDCEANLVFMSAIVTGPSVGEWEGTVVYPRFTAPAAGTYLVVVNFAGYQITMNLHGPWGTSTAYSPTPQDSAAVTALWTGTKGKSLFFSINCTGPILGYLESVQVFQLK